MMCSGFVTYVFDKKIPRRVWYASGDFDVKEYHTAIGALIAG